MGYSEQYTALKERIKQNGIVKQDDEQETGKHSSAYEKIKENIKNNGLTSNVDDAYISSVAKDAGAYIDKANEDFSSISYTTATDAALREQRQATHSDLQQRAANIRTYLKLNKDKLDQNSYNNISSYLDSLDAAMAEVESAFDEQYRYYSQWDTEGAYNSFLDQQKNVPSVVATAPQTQKSRPERLGITTATDLAETADAIRNGTYQEPALNLSKHKQGWFQKPAALNDGFQLLDIPKIALGTVADVGGNAVEGVVNLAEKAWDTGYDFVANEFANLMNLVTGGGFDEMVRFGRSVAATKRGEDPSLAPRTAEEAIKQDVLEDTFGAKEVADTYIREPAKGLLNVDVEDSPLSEKSDALVQSAGELAAQYGLTLVGVPWFVTSGLSSYGGELNNAYAQGATRDEAHKSAVITAGAEILSEYLFAGDLFTASAGADVAKDALSLAVSNKALNKLAHCGVDIFGEGFEEVFSQFMSRLGSSAYREENIGQILFSEDALDEYLDACIGGVVLGGGMTAVNIANRQNGSNEQSLAPTPNQIKTPQAPTINQIADPLSAQASPDTKSAQTDGKRSDRFNQIKEKVKAAKAAAITTPEISADSSLNAPQTPQNAPVAENLSGFSQDGNTAILDTAEQEKTTGNTGSANKPRISMEDYANQNSPVWRNVEYSDDTTKNSITQQTHDAMVAEGAVVTVPNSITANVEQSFPDLRDMKKKDRIPILRNAMSKLKSDIQQFLKGFLKQEFEFDVNGKVLEATLYTTGINEVTEKITKDKASMLYSTEEIFRNARYLYSTPDYAGDPNVYRWNYFYTPVKIGETTVGVRIAVRDLAKQGESQIYNWGIKKNASLGGVRDDLSNRKPYDASSDASNDIISKASTDVNPENSTTSVGAAPAGFDPLTHAMIEYGNIPEGENAVRDDSLPVSMDGKSKVSRVARNVLGAEATPDAFADEVRSEVANGNLSYIPITNDETVQKVEKHIQKVGWNEAYAEWVAKVEKGVTGAEMTATGAVLLNNAANAGDHKSWRNVLYHFQKLGTNTAQGLQAFRILKTLSPSDRLWMIKRSAQQMVDDLGIKNVEITLDEALVDEYDNAQTDEQRETALDKIIDSVAEQIPSKFTEKLNSFRYTMMLGNLRTQIRNLAGNASMAGITSIKNTVATSLEYLVHAVSGGKTERTKSFVVSREMMRSGMQDYDTVESLVRNGGRYALHDNETSDVKQRIQDARTIFNFGLMEGYRKLTDWAMDKGDVLFSRPAYARALAGYLKAHGITDADFSKVDPELMDKARLYAVKEAQEQTFHDTNKLSSWISQMGRGPKTPKWAKPAIEGVFPFRKTPANIAARAWEYSPMGLINSFVDTVNAARSGSETTAADAINSWAKTLTGTGLIGLGMLLQSLGLIRGTEEDDEQRAFDSLNGWQEYAFVIPGTSINFTLDAFSSAAMPILVGAQLKSIMDGEGISVNEVLDCMYALADPMVEMSLMQGFKSLLEDIRYSEEPLGQIIINSGVDYLTQFLTNSTLGQLERGTEKQRMQTYVDPDSSVPDWLQKALGAISAKTPGWDYQQIPYINAWGETEETPIGLNLLENTVSPAYFDQGEDTPLTQELNRLYNDAHQDGVYPSRPDRTVSYTDANGVKHERYGLSADEYVKMATKQGQTQKRIVEDLIASDAYKKLPDEYKAVAIEKAYYYARETAREQVLTDYAPFARDTWMGSVEGSEAEAILNRVNLQHLTDQVIPEEGYQNARQVQIVEQIAAADDNYTQDEQEAMLLMTLSEAKQKTYDKVTQMGYDIDDFAAVYRIYQKADDSETYDKKHAIRDIMRELNVSERTATTLYEAY